MEVSGFELNQETMYNLRGRKNQDLLNFLSLLHERFWQPSWKKIPRIYQKRKSQKEPER